MLAALWLVFHYAGGVAAAVIALVFIASAVNSAARKLSKITGLPKRLCAALLVTLILLAVCASVVLAALRLAAELRGLIEDRAEILLAAERLLEKAESLVTGTGLFSEDSGVQKYLDELLVSAANKLTALCLSALGGLAAKTPAAVAGAFAFIVLTVWLSVDYDKICRELCRLMPKGLSQRIRPLKNKIVHTARRYLSVTLKLFLLTFCETYVGLLMLRLPYALLLSFAVAAVDMLPALGSGIVLVPISVIAFAVGERGLGLGVLILFGVVTVTRQIAEPHIVGKSFGIHPFLSMLSMLAGLFLFGPLGALLAPITLALITER